MNEHWTLVIGSKHFSSWSLRPWLALKYAGIPFEEKTVLVENPGFKNHIKHVSPNMKVPVLITPQITISESLAICEYAAERVPSLWPHDPIRRAHARAISHEMHAGFQTLRQKMPMKFASTGLPSPFQSAALEHDIRRILSIWTECLTKYNAEGPFLFGTFTIADAMFAPVVSRFKTYGIEMDHLTKSYADAIWSLPLMQEWLSGAKREL